MVTVTNKNPDIIIGRDTILIEIRSKNENETEFGYDFRSQEKTLFPNEGWGRTIGVYIPGNTNYKPAYSLEVYVFYNGELFYTTSKYFPPIN